MDCIQNVQSLVDHGGMQQIMKQGVTDVCGNGVQRHARRTAHAIKRSETTVRTALRCCALITFPVATGF